MSIIDYLMIIFLVLIPPIILLSNIQEKLEGINFRKYWKGTVNKITMLLCSIWAVLGFIIAGLGLLKLFKGSDAYGLIAIIVSVIAIYFGIEIISLGIAKMIDKFNKEEKE